MRTKIIRYFWPEIRAEEVRKFALLSSTLFFILGSYWLLRALKDTVFMKIAFPVDLGWVAEQGGLYQPIAKMWSPIVIILVVIVYSKLVDLFQKHQLFYVVCSFYGLLFGSITILLGIRDYWGDEFLGGGVLSAIGWTTYFGVESFGSIMVPLFWSYTNSISTSESAKSAYPFIIAGAQIGATSGSFLALMGEYVGGVWQLFAVATAGIVCVGPILYYFIWTTPKEQLQPSEAVANADQQEQKQHEKEGVLKGFFGGLILLLSRPYLLGILVISTVYEIVATVTDYQMKRQASLVPEFSDEVGFARFLGFFGVVMNLTTFTIALSGTSYLLKRFGNRTCLLIFPAVVGICLSGWYLFYVFEAPGPAYMLWATFGITVVMRALTYGLNNPTKEIMYIPTSQDVRYKAKAWIDMFGSRSSKMLGSQFTNALKHDLPLLMGLGTLLSLGVVGFWLVVAFYVGTQNQRLLKRGEVVH